MTVPVSLTAGAYSLVAIVDDLDNVAESDETNNALAAGEQIELTDCVNSGPEICFDGVDNDCDGAIDQADTDCQLMCTAAGAACTSDSQCCSLKCRGGQNKTCKGDTTCTPTEISELSCSDGVDNDCDGSTDGLDSDCQAACEPKGAACTADSQCCSNKCRGPGGNQSCK